MKKNLWHFYRQCKKGGTTYIQGSPFVIKTDQISLKYLLEQRLHHTLQHKGLCKLLGLEYTIQYKKGVENKVADALSRVEHEHREEVLNMTVLVPQWIEDLRQSYEGDQFAQQILEQHKAGAKLADCYTVQQGRIKKN